MDLVGKADLAKMGKVASALISRNIRKGSIWFKAYDKESKKIDIDHPVIQEWLDKRASMKSPDEMMLKDYEHLTLKEIMTEYGSIPQFQDICKTYKTIADTELRKIQIEQNRGELVSRDHVAKVCFGYLETLNKRLLEMPSGRAPKIIALVESGSIDLKEKLIESLVKEIAKILKGTKRDLLERIDDNFDGESMAQDILEDSNSKYLVSMLTAQAQARFIKSLEKPKT